MRHLIKQLWLTGITFISLVSLHGQNNNPCNMRWAPWQTVMTHSMGNVSIRIQYSDCNKDGGVCGWPKIELQHSFSQPASIDVTLEGIDCEGKVFTSSFSTAGDEIAGFRE